MKMKNKTISHMTKNFEMKVDWHHGSSISTFLLNLLFKVIMKGVKRGVSFNIMYNDYVRIIGESIKDVEAETEKWHVAIESKIMKKCRRKTKYKVMTDRDEDGKKDFAAYI